MAQVPREDVFNADTRWKVLRAVGVGQGTTKAESFLSQLSAAVESYRKVFPEGRPNGDPKVTARGLLDLARGLGVPGAIRHAAGHPVGHAAGGYAWVVAVEEGKKFGKLLDVLRALSPDAEAVLAHQAFLVVDDMRRLKAACEELSEPQTLRRRRTPRVLREDVQFLVNSVAWTFVDHYTGWVDGWRRCRGLENEGRRRGEKAFRDLAAGARSSFREGLQDVLVACSWHAGVHPTGKPAAIDLGGVDAWRFYCLPCLEQRQWEKPHKALWWLPVRKPAGEPSRALREL